MRRLKHTPGPWTIGRLLPTSWRYICGSNGDTVAAVAEWESDGTLIQEFTQQAYSNANLIASAPELLDALFDIASHDLAMIKSGEMRHFVELDRALYLLKKLGVTVDKTGAVMR